MHRSLEKLQQRAYVAGMLGHLPTELRQMEIEAERTEASRKETPCGTLTAKHARNAKRTREEEKARVKLPCQNI